jgi:hypothetical protein
LIVDTFLHETPEGKGIIAELNEKGVVTFAVDAGEGSSIRGTELFNRMMAYFGTDARVIQGVWRKSPSGRPSANIDKVNELTGAGMSLEDAIQRAWTVTRAKKLGFTNVSVLDLPEGSPGAYVAIDVLIERETTSVG